MSALAGVVSNLRAIEATKVTALPPLERADPARAEPRVPARPAFRHSVVPRGAYTADEVAAAMSRDRVVATHYSGVNLQELRAERQPEVLPVYMSYRIGDEIFWTKQKVGLKQGETILTDGVNHIRARCGNRVAFAPMEPTADDEPDDMEFDVLTDDSEVVVPVDTERLPQPVAGIPFVSIPGPSPDPFSPADPIEVGSIGIPVDGYRADRPEVPFTYPSLQDSRDPGDPGDPGNPHQSIFLPTEDPVVAPEPATLLLVGGGLAALLTRRHRRR
jgi:hypothetical protein